MGERGGRYYRIPALGGTVETITKIDSAARETSHRLPHFLPGGHAVLFTVLRFNFTSTTPAAWSVWSLRLETGQRTRVVEQASDARYVDGHIVFIREGSLYAARFDPERLELTGDPRLVLQGVQHAVYASNTDNETGAALFALSPTGTLAYAAGSVTPERKKLVVVVDRDGNETPVDIEPGPYGISRGSPDGRRPLLWEGYQPTRAVWLHDLERGLTSRQAFGTGFFATWGPEQDEISAAKVGGR